MRPRRLAGLTSDDVLIVHNANPAHTHARLGRRPAQGRAQFVYLGTMLDETAALADWVLPVDSPLESWGDYEPVTRRPQPDAADDGRASSTRGRPATCCWTSPGRRAGRSTPAERTSRSWLRRRWADRRARRSGRAVLAGRAAPGRRLGGAVRAAERRRSEAASSPPRPPTPGGGRRRPVALAQHHALRRPHRQPRLDAGGARPGQLRRLGQPDRHPSRTWRSGWAWPTATWSSCATSAGARARRPRASRTTWPAGVAALAFGQGHTRWGAMPTARGANAFALLGDGRVRPGERPQDRARARAGLDVSPRRTSTAARSLQWVRAVGGARHEARRGRRADPAAAGGLRPEPRPLPAARVQGAPLGDGDRPAPLHRLRGLRGGLLRGEQPPRRGPEQRAPRAARWPG